MALVLFFGKLQDVVGQSQASIDIPSSIANTHDLRKFLNSKFGLNGDLQAPSIRIAVNGEIIDDHSSISNQDEIAFLPPVGGG